MSVKTTLTRRTLLGGLGASALTAGILSSATASAQGVKQPLKLDVPYVPTPQKIVDRMLTIAKVSPEDFVMDLGCGDGRMLVTATSKFGAKGGYGVDLNPVRIKEATENARIAGVSDKVKFEIRDLFTMSIAQANVLTMYLLPDVNLRLRPRILDEMKPGSRIVSHDFNMDDWRADYFEAEDGHDIYFWVVPAKVGGDWSVRADGVDYTLSLRQRFQYFDGVLRDDKSEYTIRMGRIVGERLNFTAEAATGKALMFSGRIDGDTMKFDPAAVALPVNDWSATRKK